MASVNNDSASKVAYSYLQYKNKIGGLVSGMDIDSLMEKLMKAESAQMEKLQQQKQKYEWQRDAYREVNTSLSSFEQGIFDDYGKQSSWNTKTVSNSASDKVKATATSSASGNLEITEAVLATAGTVKNVSSPNLKPTSTMADLNLTDGTFKLIGLNAEGKDFVEKEITFKSTDTIESVLNKINTSGVGITAVMSTNNGEISLTSNTAGEGINVDGVKKVMAVSEDTQGVFKKLGFFEDRDTIPNEGVFNTIDTAKNGYIKVNNVTIEQSSNNYEVAGYKLEIIEPITAKVKISSSNDTDKVIDKVKAFIETYNGLIKDLNTKVTQKKNVDYSPLTDAQKAEMTTDEITKWEEKAKAGLLKGDANINAALSSMRQTLSAYNTYKIEKDADGKETKVSTPKNTDVLFKIGITTSTSYSDNGKLEIDEDKLRKALEEDPDIVSRIFTGDSATGAEGVVSQLRTAAKNAVSNIEVAAGKATSTSEKSYSIGRTISDLSTKIDDWKDRLKDIEERYWNQFSAMEKAIQKANSQTSIFSA